MAKTQNEQNNHNKPNIWGMLRDVAIASLNKGQFPMAIVGGLFFTTLLKMDSAEVTRLVFETLNLFKSFHLVGWGLSGVSILGWYLNSKWLWGMHRDEIERISQEKKELQQHLTGKNLSSSNK